MCLIESSGLLLPLTFQWSLSQIGLQSPTQRCCWQGSETGVRGESRGMLFMESSQQRDTALMY